MMSLSSSKWFGTLENILALFIQHVFIVASFGHGMLELADSLCAHGAYTLVEETTNKEEKQYVGYFWW